MREFQKSLVIEFLYIVVSIKTVKYYSMKGGSGGGLNEFIKKQKEFNDKLNKLSSAYKIMDNGLLGISSQFKNHFSDLNNSLLSINNQSGLSNIVPEHPLKNFQNNITSFTDSVGSLSKSFKEFNTTPNLQVPDVGGLNAFLEINKLTSLFSDINNIGSNSGLGGINNILKELAAESVFNSLAGLSRNNFNSLNHSIEELSVYLGTVDEEEKENIEEILSSTGVAIQDAQRSNSISLFLTRIEQVIIEFSQNNSIPKPAKKIVYDIIIGLAVGGIMLYFTTASATEEQVKKVEVKVEHNIEQVEEIKEVVEESKVDIEKIAKGLEGLQRIAQSSLYYSDANLTAIAEKKVHLRKEPNRRSKSILVVQVNQEVTVLAERFRWIYISMKKSDGTVVKGWTYGPYYK